MTSAPVGVVLTGGASRRMGSDKALLPIAGTAMAVRVAKALAEGGCRPVWCQGGDATALAALGLSVHADDLPGAGPLGAIGTALSAVAGDAAARDVVVAACDLPDLDAATVAALVAAAQGQPEASVVVAADASGPHLLGLWRAATAERVAGLLADGVRSYRQALERLDAVFVTVPDDVLRNVNSPGDLI